MILIKYSGGEPYLSLVQKRKLKRHNQRELIVRFLVGMVRFRFFTLYIQLILSKQEAKNIHKDSRAPNGYPFLPS
jgi:hypothetical protein